MTDELPTAATLRLHLGELTADEVRVAKAAIRFDRSQRAPQRVTVNAPQTRRGRKRTLTMTDLPDAATLREELKPCPFCANAAIIEPDSEHSTAFILQHFSKGCPIDDLWDWYPDAEQAIAAWNQRPPRSGRGGQVMTYGGPIVKAITKTYGDRCPDHEPNCPCCQAWEAYDAIRATQAENERLREALEPSGETKAEYIGDFSVRFPMFDDNGEEYTHSINVPWTTIKEIMCAIRQRAALAGGDGPNETDN